ncbi:hypothetical protein ACGFIV_00815 [Sphaerisporangium sp. NPDC049003]|uniref:hypothetical protein n=1 Tax=Sphaerisporangium sp. NPDC049003 TaxID=3364517 RepID=UPI0037134642
MTLTGTFVLALTPGDTLTALAQAAQLGTAALGLLLRYVTRPPRPGVSRDELAQDYGLSVGALRRDNGELADAGFLMQARRPVGKGGWQHLILVATEPGRLPAEHEAWVLLDAALAADQANTSAPAAHVATCDDTEEPQVATCVQNPHIEPVNPFSPGGPRPPGDKPQPSVVATVAELRQLAQLPPLPAPADQGDLWLTPGQVLSLTTHYPPRHGDLALGVLARVGLPFYLAPRVMALLMQGYDTGQLGRTLRDVHEGEHPSALARWRLDQMLLAPDPDHVAWRAPSSVIEPPATGPAAEAATARGASLARALMRERGIRA